MICLANMRHKKLRLQLDRWEERMGNTVLVWMWSGTVCGVVVKVKETSLMEMQWSEKAQSNAASFVQHPVILQYLLLLEKIHSTEKKGFVFPWS